MAFIVVNTITNEPRESQARAAAVHTNAVALNQLNYATSAAGSAQATNTTGIKTVNTLTSIINGIFITGVGATDPMWTLGVTGSSTLVAKASWQKYLLLHDGTTATALEGTQSLVSAAAVSWKNISGVSSVAAYMTALGSTKFLASVMTIATDATHTFTPGTTSLTATGITATFIDGIDQSLLPFIANETGIIIGNGG